MSQRNIIRNRSPHPDAEVGALIRRTLRDLEVTGLCITVRGTKKRHCSGSYRPIWFPGRGEDREQIFISLSNIWPSTYNPYNRKDGVEPFELRDWREGLVAIAAHEAMHHRQTLRHDYGARRRGKYVERECDYAALRAVQRYRG